ncbi:hypothetical protein KUTeg_004979 [Tegillarca granosa]|uniref:Uncharacterized protein n=1 Tax=Tegillarca granosa TaxID=220873 RepID=A0ABQ9FIG3_TEGGR|nr:hypothetical protein KUTeg_004979 [Tegillarca granosa]
MADKPLIEEKRYKEFVSSKKVIIDLFHEMDRNPDSDFERDILEEEKIETKKTVNELWDRLSILWDRLWVSENDRNEFRQGKQGIKVSVIHAVSMSHVKFPRQFVCWTDRLNVIDSVFSAYILQFEYLKHEIAECERKKLENIQRFIEGMRKELVTWWDKCFFSKKCRDEFLPFQDGVSRWEVLFRQMIENEKKANDPNRFNNRGGMLLQEEKARKKVLKELSKLEEEVKEIVMNWEKENGREFLVDGVRFIQYIDEQWKAYQESKIKEKEERHKLRARQTEEEMIFGSKPCTPAKRRFLTTPTKTPTSKIRKLNDASRTPMSCSRLQQSSAFASPYGRRPMSPSSMFCFLMQFYGLESVSDLMFHS